MSIQTKDDDLDDEMSVANTSEQDVNFNAFSSGRSQDNRLDNDTVQNYDGRSEVGNKKKFSGGNAPLMFLLIAMAIGLVGYGIYYAKNMSLGAKGEVEEEVSQDENPANTRQRDFNKEFEQFQSVETQEQQNAELIAASGGANAEGQSMGQSMNNGVEPVNPQYNQADYQSQQPYNPQPNQQTAPQSQAPVLTPAQERMQRLLGSSFTGQSGSMNAAKRDTARQRKPASSTHGYPAHNQNEYIRPFSEFGEYRRPPRPIARRWHYRTQPHCWHWSGCRVSLLSALIEQHYSCHPAIF